MNKYPYQETDIDELFGEEWREIRDAPHYQVSNLGRVRSMDRIVPHPRLKQQFVKGRILKQSIYINKNSISDLKRTDLRATVNIDGQPKTFNVRRLVYDAFIERINYNQKKMYVINKDGDGFNNRADNLELVTPKEKSKRAFEQNRVPESYLKKADRSKWTKPHGGSTQRKPVIQLKDGKEIARYPSIGEASRSTGIGEKEIIGVAKRRYKSWNGYVFRYVE